MEENIKEDICIGLKKFQHILVMGIKNETIIF